MDDVYIDTSAFLAVLNAGDEDHTKAASIWYNLLDTQACLVTNSFVLVETYALIQNRLGLDAVRTFSRDILPLLTVKQSLTSFLSSSRRDLSMVDCSSFTTMIQLGIIKVFTFDSHFSEQGFEVLI